MTLRKRECWKLKEKALDRTLWGTRFGRGCELVRHTTKYESNDYVRR